MVRVGPLLSQSVWNCGPLPMPLAKHICHVVAQRGASSLLRAALDPFAVARMSLEFNSRGVWYQGWV